MVRMVAFPDGSKKRRDAIAKAKMKRYVSNSKKDNIKDYFERHGKDFNAKNECEYIRSIKALLNKPIGGNIIGYDTSTGRTVRADTNKQLFASANLKKRRNLHWIF